MAASQREPEMRIECPPNRRLPWSSVSGSPMVDAMASMVRTMPSFVTVLPNWSGKRGRSSRSSASGKPKNSMTTS
eukprot:15227778-Heterocapsa_arctica.AAC.1